jgi:hypothetical protein
MSHPTQIRHVDSLSRAIQSVYSCSELKRDVVTLTQREDKFCQSLDVGRANSLSEYFVDDSDVIYRRRKNGEHQLVVPASLASKVIV